MIHHARSHNACVPITPEMRVELYRQRLANRLMTMEIDHDDVQKREWDGHRALNRLRRLWRKRERS